MLVEDLRPLPFQSGVLIGIAGHPVQLEVFDSSRTLADAWNSLLAAAALDAIDQEAVPTPGSRARKFVERVRSVQADPGAVQQDVRRQRSSHVELTTLAWNGRTVHAVARNPRHELVGA